MFKKILLLLMVIGPVSVLYAQTGTVKGKITDAEKGLAIPSVQVRIGINETFSLPDGTFELARISQGTAVIDFSISGYQNETRQIEVNEVTDLGVIQMKPASVSDLNSGLAEINLAGLDSDDDAKSQNISGLLSSSNDVFVAAASYSFSSAYFRMRGYDADLSGTYLANSPINDAETGRTLWALWGGLNDATRNKISVNGLAPSSFSFGNLGGVTNIITRASQQRPQTKLTYSMTDRTYTNRVMLTHSTGLMDNDGAVTLSISRRWGNGGYVEGTWYDAYAWFLSVEKKLNEKHSIAFTALDSPVKRGMQGGSTQEAYDLTGSNFYNPNWGYQNGELRNARIRKMDQPILALNHFWNPSSKTQITNTISYLFGKTSTTALNWYKAADPRPDYYRYLPSYYPDSLYVYADLNTDVIDENYAEAWRNDPSTSQIDWDNLYQQNYLGSLEGEQAHYIIEDRHNDQTQFNINSVINHELNDNIKVNGGFELSSYNVHYYKILDDLLGGEFWRDIDQFSERDFKGDTAILQNDLNNPNRIIHRGDKFGYDYKLHQNSGNIWSVVQVAGYKFDYYGGLQLTYTSFWREGFMRNGRYPEDSYGNSEKHNFFDYAIKAGGTYKFTGRHFLEGNLTYMTRAPFIRNSFISPRTRHGVIPGLTNEKIFSGEISYHLRAPRVKARITAYHTIFADQCEVFSGYHDDFKTFVNYATYNTDKIHQGIEAGAEIKLTSAFSAILAGNLGNYRYTNRPTTTIVTENGSLPDSTSLIYTKNFYVPGTPQTALSAGLKYAGPRYLFIEANVNYFADTYLDFNPSMRAAIPALLLLENFIDPSGPLVYELTRQSKADDGLMVNLSIGKSFRIADKYFLNLNFSISNLFDNTDLITGGYEQSRYTISNAATFVPKIYYAYGRTYFLNIGFRF
ncbi:MAG TPA: hypothetical protein VK212_01880 [Lentimicrobium sp.]|nr:hypothetical protein [Lentimicrobium sp.]